MPVLHLEQLMVLRPFYEFKTRVDLVTFVYIELHVISLRVISTSLPLKVS